MRIITSIVLLLLGVSISQAATKAHVLYIESPTTTASDANTMIAANAAARETNHLKQISQETGIDITIAPATVIKTLYCATGNVDWNDNRPIEHFDAIMHGNFLGRRTIRIPTGYYHPESLTLVAYMDQLPTKKVSVPQLFLGYSGSAGLASGGINAWLDGTTNQPCSTGSNRATPGVTSDPSGLFPGAYFQEGYSDKPFRSGSYATRGFGVNSAVAGGIRPILWGAINSAAQLYKRENLAPLWADSLYRRTQTDSTILWKRLMTHNNSKEFIFCWYMGSAACQDSEVLSSNGLPCEGNYDILLAALAVLDSTLQKEGKYLFDPVKLPLKFGLVIEGGFERSGRHHYTGLYENDRATLSATIDSMIANDINIPAVLSVDVDSIAQYQSDKAIWDKWTRLKVSPMTRFGIDSTIAGNTRTSFTRPVDMWGRWRFRAIYGDGSCTSSDTSWYCNILAGYNVLNTYWPSSKISKFLIPPDKDWTSKLSAASQFDSMVNIGSSKLGISGWLVNAQRPWTQQIGLSYGQSQGRYLTPQGYALNLLGHTGYSIGGGSIFYDIRSDSDGPDYQVDGLIPKYALPDIPAYEIGRSWAGLLFDSYLDYDFCQYNHTVTYLGQDFAWENINKPLDDRLYRFKRAYIIRKGPNDFAGDIARPPRTAYWQLKAMKNEIDTINRLCGKTVVMFDYPENISPRSY